jgi:hypothetical protein
MIGNVMKWIFRILAILSIICPFIAPKLTPYILILGIVLLGIIQTHKEKFIAKLAEKTPWQTKAIIVIAVVVILVAGLFYPIPNEIIMGAITFLLNIIGENVSRESQILSE